MAIKASAQITISKVIDVYAVYRYYKLQASTLAKPCKPTKNPPDGWSDTEPSYVSGSTNTLYFVDCNVYSDKTFSFSEVSKSSSYEAAKDAWNKANNAQNTANSANSKIDGLQVGGRNLKLNGNFKNGAYGYGTEGASLSVINDATYRKCAQIVFTESYAKERIYTSDYTNRYNLSDTTYTVSFIAKASANTKLNVYRAGTAQFIGAADLTTEWKRFEMTYTATGTGSVTFKLNSAGILYLSNIKIEKGNIATDWTPAPEDSLASVDVEYYLSTSATSLAGGSWTTTAPTWVDGKYMWSRTVAVDGAGNKTYSPSQNGVCIAGAKGDTGNTGAVGKGVKSIVEQYYKSTSATSLSGDSWNTTYPGWENGKYIWTRSVITYTDDTTTTTTAVCVTGMKGDTGATGKGVKTTVVTYQASTSGTTIPTGTWQSTIPSVTAGSFLWTRTVITYTDNTTSTSYSVGKMGNNGAMGETLSNGKLLYKDVMFAEGTNNITAYNNSSGGAVTVTRQAKSTDNPCGDYELLIQNTGSASPGIGGFKWSHATRANAVFIYRIIAKIPTDRVLCWESNDSGGVTAGKFLTSNRGTGKFTEYLYKFTCGSSGSFGTTGFFYLNGSSGSSSSPVTWYVTYAGVWDMTDYEDMLSKDEAKDIYTTQLELSKTTSELRMDFSKSLNSATNDMQSKLNDSNAASNKKFGEIDKYIKFVNGNIVLGATGNEITLIVQNDRISFEQSGNEVAYFSDNQLYIRRAEVLNTLKVGNYEFIPQEDGGLTLRRRGI